MSRPSRKRGSSQAEPEVGIFWLVRGKLITSRLPLSQGASYGDFTIYEPSHYDVWTALQPDHAAPVDAEYEDFPRGRQAFNCKSEKFVLFADRCILNNPTAMSRLMREFALPPERTEANSDDHYRCRACLRRGDSE